MRFTAPLTIAGAGLLLLTSFVASAEGQELLIKTSGKLNITISGANQSCVFQPLTQLPDGTTPTCAQACAAKGACASAHTSNPAGGENLCDPPMVSSFCFCCTRGTPKISPPAQLH